MEKAVVGSRPITTFVQTDTFSYRDVVQRLTGRTENGEADAGFPGNKASPGNTKRPTTSLHERRQYTRQRLQIAKPNVLRFGPGIDHKGSLISPSRSSGILSPETPATTPTSNFSKLSISERRSRPPLLINTEEEARVIKERRFYLHPSPLSKRQDPELLNLFPMTSPYTAAAAAAAGPLPSSTHKVAVVLPSPDHKGFPVIGFL